jgi:cytosine/adenosine deaminase-related metal-dependent hydrolase
VAPYAQRTDQLDRISGSESTDIDEALNAASMEIDQALLACGFTVPVDFSQISDATTRERFEAFLSTICKALAAEILSSNAAGNRGLTSKQKKDRDRAVELLREIREGKRPLPFLPRTGATGLRVVNDFEWKATAKFLDHADAVFECDW